MTSAHQSRRPRTGVIVGVLVILATIGFGGSKGMIVDRVIPMTGIITGSVASTNVLELGSIRGVSSVEEEVGVQLPPPDASVQ